MTLNTDHSVPVAHRTDKFDNLEMTETLDIMVSAAQSWTRLLKTYLF